MRRLIALFACAVLLASFDPALAAKKKKKPRTAHTTQQLPPKSKPSQKQTPLPPKTDAPRPKPKPTPPESEVPVPKEPPPIPPPPPPKAPSVPPPAPAILPPEQPTSLPATEDLEDAAACRSALAALGVEFAVADNVETSGACTVVNPVKLSSIATSTGKVNLPGGPLLNCHFAKQFATWAADIAAPVAKAQMGANLTAISTGPGYECRGRNGDSSSKLSEHALGNAVDIDALLFDDKRRIAIGHEQAGAALRMTQALRTSGCGYFTTVLGPGSNEAHKEHFHFDLGVHGKSGNYRICE